MSFIWRQTEVSCIAGLTEILSGRKLRCLVWQVTVMVCIAGDNCWLLYGLMAFSCTCTLIYIGLVALVDRIQSSFPDLYYLNRLWVRHWIKCLLRIFCLYLPMKWLKIPQPHTTIPAHQLQYNHHPLPSDVIVIPSNCLGTYAQAWQWMLIIIYGCKCGCER